MSPNDKKKNVSIYISKIAVRELTSAGVAISDAFFLYGEMYVKLCTAHNAICLYAWTIFQFQFNHLPFILNNMQ